MLHWLCIDTAVCPSHVSQSAPFGQISRISHIVAHQNKKFRFSCSLSVLFFVSSPFSKKSVFHNNDVVPFVFCTIWGIELPAPRSNAIAPMPLTVAMPCGFEENLMDFECSGGVAASWGASSHTVTDFDHPDPLVMVSLSNKEQMNNDGIASIAGSKTDLSWCRNSRSSSMSGLAGSGSSSSSSNNNSTNNNSGLSSSSYCRRLGSAASTNGNSRRSSATFQLWSPRLRLRDERKRVLKLSLAKLRRIDDAESCLRRSVLLNNTLRRLQRDARDEKTASAVHPVSASDCISRLHHPAVRLEQPDNELQTTRSLLSCDELPVLSADLTLTETANNGQSRAASIKRRRTSADVADDLAMESPTSCGLNFSDLYLPPTPRMISSLEDEEEEAWSCVKKPKMSSSNASTTGGSDVSGRNRPALRPCNSLPSLTTSSSTSSSSSSSTNQNNSPILTGYTSCSGLSLVTSNSSAAASAQQSTYSCGQSSLFGELQSVVFHSLITSLES
ncbi:hypothetical protein GHT06_012132 [Daphnia sinensis]|uniref:SERTA domain-containing protein n=1 Tax=Daphnia sinensis TaxID=1820382 RepID=A0AAD5LEC7_9CRUS|nr:hypothetical protein GHT06_012132 [Daphnia sinensis]